MVYIRKTNTKKASRKIDPDFKFVLRLNPELEEWRSIAAKWLSEQSTRIKDKTNALSYFLVFYLHAERIETRAVILFDASIVFPKLAPGMVMSSKYGDRRAESKHDILVDFLDWVLKMYFIEPASGNSVGWPMNLRNPFQRIHSIEPGASFRGGFPKFDHEFNFLLKVDPAFFEWKIFASEFFLISKNRGAHSAAALRFFFLYYLHGQRLDKSPVTLFRQDTKLPNLMEISGRRESSEFTKIRIHDAISLFLDWVLRCKLKNEPRYDSGLNLNLRNPFPRFRSMVGGPKLPNTTLKFDPEFLFLVEIDIEFEAWRRLAVQWWTGLVDNERKMRKGSILAEFFLLYIHGLSIDKRPKSLFEIGNRLPDPVYLMAPKSAPESGNKSRSLDIVSDFLEWVLRNVYSETDENGYQVIPEQMRNPFPRTQAKQVGKGADLTFSHVVEIDPRMNYWRELAAEWISLQKRSLSERLGAIDTFMTRYIIGCDLSRNPIVFLSKTTAKPDFCEMLLKFKTKGSLESLSGADISRNNRASEFLDWILSEKLSVEIDDGRNIVPNTLHNPITMLTTSGIDIPSETVKSALSIRYIKELRAMLAQGPNFVEWRWAQAPSIDWFVVDPALVNVEDPDCVWRQRVSTTREIERQNFPISVTEMWCPARSVALYLKLELPVRAFQVRMLDSGEADTWRYVSSCPSTFEVSDAPLAQGNMKRPSQRGVFHRTPGQNGAGLYINTNKTADINKAESAKGYVIPWQHEQVLYWLEKLRNWQEKYNPLTRPVAWSSLEAKHFGRVPDHPAILEQRGVACFLFRNAAAEGVDRYKPIPYYALSHLWYSLLSRLEERLLQRGETLNDGTPICFVAKDTTTPHYTLHGLRVSLISYLVLDLQLPLAVVSKLIAGHARIVQTLYYTKFGQAHMTEVLSEAERNTFEADQANHRRFLMDATMEEIVRNFASVSVDAARTAVQQTSAASFVFEDKGVCPVGGGMCDVGGELVKQENLDPIPGRHRPVPGYPQIRNCVRCRFFLSGPAFLPGLIAHFNAKSYEAHECAERHNELFEEVTMLENRRSDCAIANQPFLETRQLENLSQRYEAVAEEMGFLISDMQATHHLIGRSLEILDQSTINGAQLVAVGQMADIHVAFAESASELYQIEILCENAVIYPEIDARKPTLRRSQLLDIMLEINNIPPVFFRLTPKQQLEVGNAVMHLIQARTGSLAQSLEYVEGGCRLRELGIIDALTSVVNNAAGTPAPEILTAVRRKPNLASGKGDFNASR